VPALLSPISPKPTKGKALARPKTEAKSVAGRSRKAAVEPNKELKVVLERCDEQVAGVTPLKTPTTRRKSLFNPPTKELVEAAAKQTARRKSLRSSKDLGLNTLFGDPSDIEEDELLKDQPIPLQASTQASTPAVEAAAPAADELRPKPVPRRSAQRIYSKSESEPELQLAAEEEVTPDAPPPGEQAVQ